MAYSTREILLALCIRDSRVHGNGTLHPVLELAARETPLRLSPEDTVVLRYHVLLEEIIERNSETFTETWNRFITHTEHVDLDFNSVFVEIFHRGDPSLGRALAWMAWCMHACRTLCCNQPQKEDKRRRAGPARQRRPDARGVHTSQPARRPCGGLPPHEAGGAGSLPGTRVRPGSAPPTPAGPLVARPRSSPVNGARWDPPSVWTTLASRAGSPSFILFLGSLCNTLRFAQEWGLLIG